MWRVFYQWLPRHNITLRAPKGTLDTLDLVHLFTGSLDWLILCKVSLEISWCYLTLLENVSLIAACLKKRVPKVFLIQVLQQTLKSVQQFHRTRTTQQEEDISSTMIFLINLILFYHYHSASRSHLAGVTTVKKRVYLFEVLFSDCLWGWRTKHPRLANNYFPKKE